MTKGDHGPEILLHAQTCNWGAFNYASHAPQVKACKYYLYMHSKQGCMDNALVHNYIVTSLLKV